jgi:hypothetical protein
VPTPPSPTPALGCPVCGALLYPYGYGPESHIRWHLYNGSLGDWEPDLATAEVIRRQRAVVVDVADEAPTTRLPPIGETVRRRPPVPPAVRELKGPELLRALADELDRDGLSIADLDTEGDDQ